MEVYNSRGLNFFRLLLIFTLVVSLFCFRDVWLPTGNDEYLFNNPIPPPDQQHQLVEKLIFDTSSPSPSSSTPPSPAPIYPYQPLTTQTYGYEEPPTNNPPPSGNNCLHLPGADKVMILLKTGATEIYSKLPTHLITTFTCIPNFKIYSDLHQTFASIPITDILAPVSQFLRENHNDFKLYQDLQKWHREGQDVSMLKGDNGWNLDKWKFLPMIHDAFESAGPEIEWFVMMEADTALSWLNLLPWLQTMDPKEPFYLGSQNLVGSTSFAHGGSGIVISRKALEILEEARGRIGTEIYDSKWEDVTANSCCGDAVLAEALKAVGVPLTGAWPVIQGERISTLDFTKENWCAVPATWHHVSPIEVDSHWQFQRSWAEEHGWDTPYLYRDVFERFVEQHVSVNRTRWDNLSKDVKYTAPKFISQGDSSENLGSAFDELEDFEQRAVESEEDCAEACSRFEEGRGCVQWMFTPGRCYLGRDLRLGRSDERNEIEVKIGERLEREYWNCGWVQSRLEELIRTKCKGRDFTGKRGGVSVGGRG